jgi:hypothetical protein
MDGVGTCGERQPTSLRPRPSTRLMPLIGFLGHASEYRPDQGRRWTGAFLRPSPRSAEWGLCLHADLAQVRHRLLETAGGRRTTCRLPQLIDRLVVVPSLSAAQAAAALGMTDRASRTLLKGFAYRGIGQGGVRSRIAPGLRRGVANPVTRQSRRDSLMIDPGLRKVSLYSAKTC